MFRIYGIRRVIEHRKHLIGLSYHTSTLIAKHISPPYTSKSFGTHLKKTREAPITSYKIQRMEIYNNEHGCLAFGKFVWIYF